MYRFLLVALLSFTLPWASSAAAQSQATTGVIEGTVSDETGGRLPGATVTLVNRGTNFTRELTTDADGRFRGLLLPLGDYVITVTPQRLRQLRPGRHQPRRRPDARTCRSRCGCRRSPQEVRVTADAPIVETTPGREPTQIDAASIRSLPNNGRNFLSFMQLTPGVTIVQGPDGDEISINGQKGINNNISVDGADFNNPFFGEQRGGQRPAFTFNQDAIQEMVVVADGAAAEFGRSGAGFVNVVTKSGTNTPAGSAHFFFKERLAVVGEFRRARSSPSTSSSSARRSAGRSGRDQLFFLLAYDQQGFDQTKQLDPAAHRAARRRPLRGARQPEENGPIDRTNDARVFLGKIDYQVNAVQPLHAPLQLHLEPAGERHVRRRLVGPQRQRRWSATSRTPCRVRCCRRCRATC